MQQQDSKATLSVSGLNPSLCICNDFHMKMRSEDSHCATVWSGGVWIKFRSKSFCLASFMPLCSPSPKSAQSPWSRRWLQIDFSPMSPTPVSSGGSGDTFSSTQPSRWLTASANSSSQNPTIAAHSKCKETKQRLLPPICLSSSLLSSTSTCILHIASIYSWGIRDKETSSILNSEEKHSLEIEDNPWQTLLAANICDSPKKTILQFLMSK